MVEIYIRIIAITKRQRKSSLQQMQTMYNDVFPEARPLAYVSLYNIYIEKFLTQLSAKEKMRCASQTPESARATTH